MSRGNQALIKYMKGKETISFLFFQKVATVQFVMLKLTFIAVLATMPVLHLQGIKREAQTWQFKRKSRFVICEILYIDIKQHSFGVVLFCVHNIIKIRERLLRQFYDQGIFYTRSTISNPLNPRDISKVNFIVFLFLLVFHISNSS